MKLADLEPQFMRLEAPGHWLRVDTLAEAQGVMFLCPQCFKTNGGPVGTHMVLTWFLGRGVPDSEDPKPGRWEALGTGIHDLTLRAGSSSVLLPGKGCKAHFFVRNGAIEMC